MPSIPALLARPLVAAVAAIALAACDGGRSPETFEDEPTREPGVDATDFDVAPSP